MPIQYPLLNRSQNRGFTLIELLVVVVIISISIGLVVVNISTGSDEDVAEQEILRLQQILRFAHEQSVIRAEEYGVRFYQTGYRFMRYDEESDSWINLDKDKLLRYRILPAPLELDLYIEQIPVELLESADDDPEVKQQQIDNSSDPAPKSSSGLMGQQADQEVIKPQVFLLSSSELTPQFELRIRVPGSEIEENLQGLPEGKYQRQQLDE